MFRPLYTEKGEYRTTKIIVLIDIAKEGLK